ncbi:MAG: radical SAM protein [Bacteroidota bacterium]
MSYVPSYLKLQASGELSRRIEQLYSLLAACTICPHDCGNNRLNNELARCYSGLLPIVSSATVHFGEEPALVGTRGVGNIFFGNCNLRCVYCQNYLISQNHIEERKNEITLERLAETMLDLQHKGVHSIGFVSPTHFVPQIVAAVDIAARSGLHLPLIYNTNSYDSVEVLRLLEGVIDIYLPDLKYADEEAGYQYSKIRRYPAVARAAIREMHRQVGNTLVYGDDGLVKRGLIIRHLVLPNDLAGSREALRWIRDEIGPHTTLSVMAQYFPTHKALTMPLVDRRIRESEYHRVLAELDKLEMDQGWIQDYEASEYYRPEFEDRDRPFKGDIDNEDGPDARGAGGAVQVNASPAGSQTFQSERHPNEHQRND